MPEVSDVHRPSDRSHAGRGRAASLVIVGALHVDELTWPIGPLVPNASNPVRRERRIGGVGANVARAATMAVARSAALAATANTAPVAARVDARASRSAVHGRDVVMIAALGDDADATWLVASLVADGVDVRRHTVDGRASGRYTVVHDERGELFVGLADTTVAETLDAAAVRARLAGTEAAALVLDANLDAACLSALLARTDTADDAPRVALAVSPAKAMRLGPFLSAVDLLFCNRREAAALGGLDTRAPIAALGDALLALGSTRFVLSDGADAVLVHTPESRTLVPVPPLDVGRSVNGAGDALAGATLVRWLDDGDLAAAVREAGLPAAAGVLGDTSRAELTSIPDTPETPR